MAVITRQLANAPNPMTANLKCPVCSKKFSDLGKLEQHIGSDDLTTATLHTCHECGRTWCNPIFLQAHQSTNDHNNGAKCPICKKRFRVASSLQQHLGTDGLTVAKCHACDKCDQTFCNLAFLKAHQDTTSHKRLDKCETCKKRFASSNAFKEHVARCVLPQPKTLSRTGLKKQPKPRFTKDESEDLTAKYRGRDWTLCDKSCRYCGWCASKCRDDYL